MAPNASTPREETAPTPPMRWLTLPNLFTVLRFLLIVPIAVLLVQGERSYTVVLLVALFGCTDWVDGFLARALGQTSRAGEILDPIADRLGIVIILAALTIAGAIPLWAVATIAIVDLVVAGVSAARLSERHRLHVTWLGKIRTAIIMASVVFVTLGLAPGGDWASKIGRVGIQVGAALHIVAGVGYLAQLLRTPRDKEPTVG